MKLNQIVNITGKIRLLTGLHIGGNKDNIEIGGMDQPIIKHPISGEPYIPGSSLKGKMRSMLETVYFSDLVAKYKGNPCDDSLNENKEYNPESVISRIFGTSNEKKPEQLGSTRIIVRDAFLSKEWKEKFEKGDLPLEEKYENTINRIKGTAEHPRPLERVPASVTFDLSISLKTNGR